MDKPLAQFVILKIFILQQRRWHVSELRWTRDSANILEAVRPEDLGAVLARLGAKHECNDARNAIHCLPCCTKSNETPLHNLAMPSEAVSIIEAVIKVKK